MLGRRGSLWFLAVPPYLWLLLLFVVPLGVVVAISLLPGSGRINFGAGWPSLNHYQEVLDTAAYLRRLGISLAMAFVIAASATILAYPIAYFLAFRARRRATIFLILLLIPFASSYLLRVMAWKLLLGREGAINWLLTSTGLTQEPAGLLTYSQAAVVITLIYVWIPFAALPIYAALQRVDRSHLEAAADLGAGPWTRFARVTIPMSLPGALATFFMVFIPTVGEYVTPSLVGGTGGIMYGNLIQDFFSRAGNWPLGSAMAVLMLLAVLVLVALALRLVDLRRMAT
ncbi:MAG TPA: ABC transporter permease [Candidatus Limnocylindria bacterium]|jgi:spermidine/putrescine transport system permease protein|nr:ABC transporter permease [Candidatus Limnocylindria bacterium]